jgi:hypothetical protein
MNTQEDFSQEKIQALKEKVLEQENEILSLREQIRLLTLVKEYDC